jgi:ribosomal protein L13
MRKYILKKYAKHRSTVVNFRKFKKELPSRFKKPRNFLKRAVTTALAKSSALALAAPTSALSLLHHNKKLSARRLLASTK